MHILQIEIDNFKSFSGKTAIPFEPGFTTISGPNGSGKSNIIDAVLFCLGLSTSRTMRAEKLTDLINHKSKRREAQVTIAFGTSFNTTEPTLVISRRIKDNGSSGYASTYYLNGRTSTLTEVHDALGQHNISPGAYNVLMQGDVTGIINMSPMERRKIIDEIAGVAEFDRKIEQAQKEIVTTTGSIERFELLMSELNSRLEQLVDERKAALKYQALLDEKKQLESQQLTAKYLDIKTAMSATDTNIIEARKQKETQQTQLNDLIKQLEGTHARLNELAQEVKKKGEDQQIALKKQVESLKGSASRKQDTIQFNTDKCTEHEASMKRCLEEQTRLQLKIDDINVAVEGFEQHQKELLTSLQEEKDKLIEAEQQLVSINEASGELSQTHQDVRQQLQALESELVDLNRQLAQLETQQFKVGQEKTVYDEQLATLSEKANHIESTYDTLQIKCRDGMLEKEAFNQQIVNQQDAVAKARTRRKDTQLALHNAQRRLSNMEAQRRAYEEMQFGRAIDTILNANMGGVHGTVSQLATCDDEYQTALEIALGGRIKQLVVDDDGVAKDCVDILKQQKAGRATFLPLNKIQGRPPKGAPPRGDGVIDYAYNLIHYDPEYADVFAYALSDTLIVEDMASARPLLTKYRMVTLDGELFERSGAITGGTLNNMNQGKQKGGLASSQGEVERHQLQQAVAQASEDFEQSEKDVVSAELKLDDLKQALNDHLANLKQAQLELDHMSKDHNQLKNMEQLEKTVQSHGQQLITLSEQEQALVKTLSDKEQQRNTLAEKLATLETELPSEEMNHIKQQITTIEFQIRALESKQQQVTNDIQSRALEREFHEKAIERYHEQIEKCKKDQVDMAASNEALQEEIALIEKQITQMEAQAGELDEELKQLQEQRDGVQKTLIDQERQKSDAQRQLTILDEQLTAFNERRHQLQGELKAIAEELKEADIDPNNLNAEDYLKAEELAKAIQKISKQMEQMGAVNMRAIEEYDTLQERNTELSEKIATLQREKTDLLEKIDHYGQLKRKNFDEAFEAIDINFRSIFAELSDGEGQLLLTNPLDPLSGGLTIQAKPRGKTTLRLESMSGGEKSLTALAFVFAFQRHLPAPFYAFDEVDMFLDGVNAEKLAQMVKKQSDNTQFIVVSLRKPMLERSERTIGVTQKKDGITKVTGVLLKRVS